MAGLVPPAAETWTLDAAPAAVPGLSHVWGCRLAGVGIEPANQSPGLRRRAGAAWCITCQVNEQVALSTPAVAAALASKDIAYLKGDWTRRDPLITRELERHGRSGVPLYLLYPPRDGAPRVLPPLLTERLVLDALNQL